MGYDVELARSRPWSPRARPATKQACCREAA